MVAKKQCPPGTKWDSLVRSCASSETDTRAEPAERPTDKPPTAAVTLRDVAPAAPVKSVMALSPALWMFVVLATLGSILALILWFVLYKRQTRHSSTTEDAEPQEPLQKTEPPLINVSPPVERYGDVETSQRAAEAPSLCPHMFQGAQTSSRWEEGESFKTCRDPTKHAGTEGGGGLPACSTAREHRIPLPATELGGTALVTTKTV